MTACIRRREFITLIGGTTATGWPLAARAQQSKKMRRIGVLMNLAADDSEALPRPGRKSPPRGLSPGV